MDGKLEDKFACPKCKKKISKSGKSFSCKNCKKSYPVRVGIPIFLDDLRESSENFSVDSLNWSRKPFWIKLRNILGAPQSNFINKPEVLKTMISNK